MHHPREGIHPPPNTVSLQVHADSIEMPHLLKRKKIAEDQVKVDGNVDAVSKEVQSDLVGWHAWQKELQCTLHDLSEIACSIDLVYNESSPQEEMKMPVSPLNDTGHNVDNNSCNGDTNHKGEELNIGNAGDEDHAVALWWRGKWQAGIRCCRVDCPLPTLKAKPTHDRKSYIVVFFPRTKTYSWVDMLLVLPIEECPFPLVNGTHRKWRKLVKDFNIPRRFIMQKLAILMLNLNDDLHIEAVVDNARKAKTWKEFALEASCCRDYSDLGKMLLKLQKVLRGEAQISQMGEADCGTATKDPAQNNLPSNSAMHENAGALGATNENKPVTFPGSSALHNVRLEFSEHITWLKVNTHVKLEPSLDLRNMADLSISDSEEEDDEYDHVTRAGTQLERGPLQEYMGHQLRILANDAGHTLQIASGIPNEVDILRTFAQRVRKSCRHMAMKMSLSIIEDPHHIVPVAAGLSVSHQSTSTGQHIPVHYGTRTTIETSSRGTTSTTEAFALCRAEEPGDDPNDGPDESRSLFSLLHV